MFPRRTASRSLEQDKDLPSKGRENELEEFME